MRTAIALRHVHFEDCGTLAEVLDERGIALRYIDAGVDSLAQVDAGEADLLIGLGGPIAVYDSALYPWIRDELAVFIRWLAARKPVIGFCLGAQMLAAALGARVFPGAVKELGWSPLQLTEEGRSSVIAPLQTAPSMLHWHGDTFDLPEGATLLASTAAVRNQIFEWDGRVLAFQCHPEVVGARIEPWLIGHAAEIAATRGVSIAQLREDTARYSAALETQSRQVFSDWLGRMRL